MDRWPIKIHQRYKAKTSSMCVEIIGVRGGKFKARVLTEKEGVYKGSHTLAKHTIYKCYDLVKNE